MSRDARERLQDILEAIRAIAGYVGGSLDKPNITDAVVLDAILFRLLVIGEAAKNVDAVLKEEASEIPWSDYAGLRDIIAHQYFRVQKRIIEDTIRRDLPKLESTVERLLS